MHKAEVINLENNDAMIYRDVWLSVNS